MSTAENPTVLATQMIQFEQKSVKEMLKWWNYVRWLSTISFLSVGIIQMGMKGEHFSQHTFILILAGIILLNIMYSFWLENFSENKTYPIVHNLLDISIFSLGIFMTGGVKSPLIWSYLIPILTSSITIGRRAGLWACLAGVFGLFLVLVLNSEFVVNGFEGFPNQLIVIVEENTHTLVSYCCLFFLVYFISSFLAGALRQQNLNLVKLNEQLVKKNHHILESQEKLVQMERKATIHRMARTIQHELNNPLAIISLNTERLVQESDDAMRERLQSVWNAIMRMRTTLAKIEKLYLPSYREPLADVKIIDMYNSNYSEDMPAVAQNEAVTAESIVQANNQEII
jgi:signal transduction histidine kinase